MSDKKYKYYFGNKIQTSVVPAIAFLLFLGMTLVLFFNHILFWVIAAAVTLLFLVAGVLRLTNRILIYDDGIMYQRLLGKTYYKDSDIESAWVEDKVHPDGSMVHFFCFKTRDGKTVRYHFAPYLADFADYLVQRILGEDVTEYEEHLDREYL